MGLVIVYVGEALLDRILFMLHACSQGAQLAPLALLLFFLLLFCFSSFIFISVLLRVKGFRLYY